MLCDPKLKLIMLRSIHTTLQLRCGTNISLSAASHRNITAFRVKMNLTFMRHRNAVTLQFLCSRVQCGNTAQLRRSMNGPSVCAIGKQHHRICTNGLK